MTQILARIVSFSLLAMATRASAQTKLLSPLSIAELPAVVRDDLSRRGCLVPQTWGQTSPNNVVSGSFRRRGQTDVAVLCSVRGYSSIRVYWGRRRGGVSVFAGSYDESWIQSVATDEDGFSRMIQPVRRGPARDGRRYPHDGIEDFFVEKGSVVYRFHGNEWIESVGSD